MDTRISKLLSVVVLLLWMTSSAWTLASHRREDAIVVTGNTMGTTYHVTYFDRKGRIFKPEIETLLVQINHAISNYDAQSDVSRFNASSRGIKTPSRFFIEPLKKAFEVYHESNGSFDPTVMPLVNAWGFGPGKSWQPDQKQVDSILTLVGLDKIRIENDSIVKNLSDVQLDFGGIGQGYAADKIVELLQSKGVTDMLVELGGEGVALGINVKSGKPWTIGILDPESTLDNQFFKAHASLQSRAFTTSGNYFNYKIVDGKRYSHIIDPKTGYPTMNPLLSVSVFASDCTTSDAWATALMVMGPEKAISWAKNHTDIPVLLFYSDSTGNIDSFITPSVGYVKLVTSL